MSKKILLVEDEPVTALVGKKILEKNGFSVMTANSGEAAIATISTTPDIDLVLMDIDLGDSIDGTEAAALILSEYDLPLIFLSSHTEPEIVNKTKSITNYGYVVKNTGEVVLIAAIEMALKLFESNQAIKNHVSQQQAMVEVLFELHTKMDIPFSDLMNYVIEASVKLTRSTFAFGGLLSEDETVMTIHAWSTGAMDICSVEKNPIHFPIVESGVWGECVRQRGPVIINDYASCPGGKGYPAGHVPITNFLAVPVFDGNRIVAVGASANRDTPFDVSDAQVLISLYQRLWEIVRRKGLENILSTNVTMLSRAQNIAHIGNWVLDIENNHLSWSDEVYRIFGLKPQEFDASYEAFLDAVHPDDRVKVNNAYSESLTNKKGSYEIEHRVIQRNSGSILYVFEKCFHEYNEEGNVIRSTGIVQDITERKQSELDIKEKLNIITSLNQELETSNEEFEQINEELMRSEEELLSREKASAESENRERELNLFNQTLLESMPVPVFYKDVEGRYIGFNKAFEKFFGRTKDELIGKSVFDISPGELAEIYHKKDKELLENPGVQIYDSQVKNARGELMDVIFHKSTFTDFEGRVKGLVGAVLDVTERNRLYMELSESTAHFKALYNATFGGISIHDKGLILDCNQGLADMTGYSVNELIGMNGLELIAEKSRNMVMKNILAGTEKPYEAIGLRKNNEEYPLIIEGQNIPYKGKNVRVAEFRDLSELKQTHLKFESYIINSPTPIFIANTSGDYFLVNPAACRLTGYNEDELLTMNIKNIAHPDDYEKNLQTFPQLLDGKHIHQEITLRHKNGDKIYVILDSLMLDEKNIIGFCTNITERKKSEEKLIQALQISDILREKSDILIREKEIILKESHHRIKNNMNIIMGLLYLHAEDSENSSAKTILTDSALRVQSMMLLYDKLYRTENLNNINIKEYLPSLIGEILTVLYSPVDIKTETNIDDIVLNSSTISSLGLIVNELLTNSFKHAFAGRESGFIKISVSKKEGRISLIYSDNGTGFTVNPGMNDSTFGLNLIEMMVQQIKGTLQYGKGPGMECVIKFTAD